MIRRNYYNSVIISFGVDILFWHLIPASHLRRVQCSAMCRESNGLSHLNLSVNDLEERVYHCLSQNFKWSFFTVSTRFYGGRFQGVPSPTRPIFMRNYIIRSVSWPWPRPQSTGGGRIKVASNPSRVFSKKEGIKEDKK